MDRNRIGCYILKQSENLLSCDCPDFVESLWGALDGALERYRICFERKVLKYDAEAFPCYNADAYVALLYFVSNEMWRRDGHGKSAEKIYLLNRYINSVDIFYNRKLPTEFHLNHPLGTILGDAKYGERFVAYQHVTVGGNMKLELPEIGDDVILFAGVKVIGKSRIGNGCQLGAGVTIYNEDVDDGTCLVLDRSANKIVSGAGDNISSFFKGG